jgi:hypothetical protein
MKTITNQNQAIDNILKFNEEVNSYLNNKEDLALDTLVNNIPHYRAWYCIYDLNNDSYYFAPSKYIGYSDINANTYTEFNRNGLDGRKTESILSTWYETLSKSDNLHGKLSEQLMEFCAKYDKKPNSLFRINVPLNKPTKATLEDNVIEFIWNAYKNLSSEARKEVKDKINRYRADS